MGTGGRRTGLTIFFSFVEIKLTKLKDSVQDNNVIFIYISQPVMLVLSFYVSQIQFSPFQLVPFSLRHFCLFYSHKGSKRQKLKDNLPRLPPLAKVSLSISDSELLHIRPGTSSRYQSSYQNL